MRSRSSPLSAVTLAVLGVALLTPAAFAQVTQEPTALDSAVYVRDSSVALEKLDLASRLERAKQWDKAADVYQEISEKFADRVVPTIKDDAGKPRQYVSAARMVQDRVAAWPADGLAAYRRRFEDTARDSLNTADDARAAERTMKLYFVTDAGRDAAMSVLGTAFEAGEFAAAAAVGQQLLDRHPALVAERPRVLLQTALAEHLAGRTEDARKRLDELKSKFPDALVRVAGEDAKAADALQVALATPAPAGGGFRSDDWPVPFGNASGSAVPGQISNGGARMFAVDLPGTPPRGANTAAVQRDYRNRMNAERRVGTVTGVLPVVDGGTLFFSDNARVWAINLASGLPLTGWTQSYPGDKRGTFSIDAAPTPRGKQTAVSVTPFGVVALLGQHDSIAAGSVPYTPQPPQVVCLDRVTGRRNWSTSVPRLKLPNDDNNLREGVFYGTPVVNGDSVYVLVNANRGNQFEECYLVALRLSDGGFRWASYVASTSRMMDVDNFGEFNTASTATVSLDNGRLYVLTNLGAVACLDTADGTVQWLNIYDRPPTVVDPRRSFVRPRPSVVKPFESGPPVVVDGRVFVLPTDSTSLFVYDAADGSTVKEIPRTLEAKFPAVQSVLGVVGDGLLLANRSTIFRVPWRTYDPAKSLVDNDGRYKRLPAAEGDTTEPPDSICGRPFLAANAILVPTAERLYRIAVDSFKTESVYPSQGKWDDEESPGNVVATPENLILAGPTKVTVYADLTVATAKLDARLAADPADVEASLRYAELLFAAGQPTPALARLDEAAAKLGGLATLTPGPTRARFFDIAVNFAAKLQRDATDAGVVGELYDRAAAAADSPREQVRYRLSRAALYRTTARANEEIALHQQILANPAWRATPVTGRGGPSTAGAEAGLAITDIIRQNGPAVYAAFDAAAAKAFTSAKQAEMPDPAALIAIADQYPAAAVTPDALALAADRFEAVQQPRRVTQTLRQLLKRDLSNERRQIVLQSLARNYLLVPNQVATAQVRLRQAREFAPLSKLTRPLLMPDGRPLAATTVAEAVTALDGYRATAQRQMLPVLGAPPAADGDDPAKPPLSPPVEVAAATALIAQQADVARADRVVVVGPDRRVGVVVGNSGQVNWTDAAPADAPLGGGFVGDTLVTVAADEVTAIDAAGKTIWKIALTSLPGVDLAAGATTTDNSSVDKVLDKDGFAPPMVNDGILLRGGRANRANRPWFRRRIGRPFPLPVPVPEVVDEETPAAEKFTQYRLLSDRVVVASSTGRLVALDIGTGATAWQTRVSELPVGRLLSNDDFVAVSFTDPGTGSDVYVFDAVTGQTLLRKTYDGNTNPQAGGLINLALSPDGVLVTMLAGRLTGTDLYDASATEWKRDAASPTNPGEMPFLSSSFDGQLVITGDRVLAVHNGRNTQQSVRAYALRTLKPMTTGDARASEASFGLRDSNLEGHPLTITASGPHFYVVGHRSVAGYDLDRPFDPEDYWRSSAGAGDRKPTRDFILAQDYAVMVSQTSPAEPATGKLPGIRLWMYSRATVAKGRESGSLESFPILRDPAGIVADEWQVADGAFYFITGDGKLKVARANR